MDDIGLIDVCVHQIVPNVLRSRDIELGWLVHQTQLSINVRLLLSIRQRCPGIPVSRLLGERVFHTYHDFLWLSAVHSGACLTGTLA